MILIKNIVVKDLIFTNSIKGCQKSDFFLFDNFVVLNQTIEENLEIFFLSRLFRYLNLPVFKTYLAKDSQNNLLVLMDDLYSKTDNIQFGYQDNDNFLDLSYLFYLNKDIMKKYYQRSVNLVILDNYDNISKVNIFFNKNSDIFYIDINNIKPKTANFYFSQSFEDDSFIYLGNIYNYNLDTEFIKVIKSNNDYLFKIYSNNNLFTNEIFLKDKFKISINKFKKLNISNAIKLIKSNFVVNENYGISNNERYDLIVKYFMVKILENYYKGYGDNKIEDFLAYIKSDYNDEISRELLNVQRQTVIEIIRNVLLLDNTDINYITLNYNTELLFGITKKEILNFKNYILDKQLELFYYASKYKFLHKIINKDFSQENIIHDNLKLNNILYFDINKIGSIEKLENSNIYNREIISLLNKHFSSCLKKKSGDYKICEQQQNIFIKFFEYKFESQGFKNYLKPKLIQFQNELRKEFNKKLLVPWTQESFSKTLYSDIDNEYTIYNTVDYKNNIDYNKYLAVGEEHKLINKNYNTKNFVDYNNKQNDVKIERQSEILFIKSNILLCLGGLVFFGFLIFILVFKIYKNKK